MQVNHLLVCLYSHLDVLRSVGVLESVDSLFELGLPR